MQARTAQTSRYVVCSPLLDSKGGRVVCTCSAPYLSPPNCMFSFPLFSQDMYIDIGCRIKGSWVAYVLAQMLPEEWADIRIMVPWMHASSHNMACQLLNNARFQLGAARRVGENSEQLWSMLRGISGCAQGIKVCCSPPHAQPCVTVSAGWCDTWRMATAGTSSRLV